MRRIVWGSALIVLAAAACTNGSQATETSSQPSTRPPDTVNVAGIPPAASVRSLEWEGSVRVVRSAGGEPSSLSAAVRGSFVAPGDHRLAVSSESSSAGGSEAAEWEATIVGGRGWVLEGGDLRAFEAEGVADEYMTVLGTATGCVIPPPALLAELAGLEPESFEERDGRRLARFDIRGASPARYAPLFASDFGLAFGASVQTADVGLVVDTESGLVLEAALFAVGRDGDLEVEMAFRVTGVDDPSIVVAAQDGGAPGVEDLVRYEDPAGRFAASYPPDWDVDEFAEGASFSPPFTRSRAYASVLVTAGATLDEAVDRILADAAPGTEVLESGDVSSGGLGYRHLVLRFSEGEDVLRGWMWVTVADGTGFAFQVVVEERRYPEFADLAEAMFSAFLPAPG